MATKDDSPNYEINNGDVKISNHYFGNHFRWTEPPGDEPKTMEEAQARIDKLYESGVPFFSKEMIRFAFEQCQRKTPRLSVGGRPQYISTKKTKNRCSPVPNIPKTQAHGPTHRYAHHLG